MVLLDLWMVILLNRVVFSIIFWVFLFIFVVVFFIILAIVIGWLLVVINKFWGCKVCFWLFRVINFFFFLVKCIFRVNFFGLIRVCNLFWLKLCKG